MKPSEITTNKNELLAQAQNRLIENLRISEKRYSDLVENLKDVIFQLDIELTFIYLNKAWSEMTGFEVGESIGEIFISYIHPDDNSTCKQGFQKLLNQTTDELSLQIRLMASNNKLKILELSCKTFTDEIGQIKGISGILNDITERIESEKRITFLAYHDVVTGLANRRLLMDDIQDKIKSITDEKSALMFIDLDRFKQVNDIYGHVVGDLLLVDVTEKLKRILANCDCLISRIGGDEFVVSLNLNTAFEQEAKKVLISICEKVLNEISKKTVLRHVSFNVTASIGAVFLDSDVMNKDSALTFADAAMYKSKHKGRNCFHLYDKTLEAEERKQKEFEKEIQTAIQTKQFILYYQPQINIKTNKIEKVEALIRWQHPNKGVIYPDQFIPYLEQSGLIENVGLWVLEEGCKQLSIWREQKPHAISISINISANQILDPGFVNHIHHFIKKYDISPSLLELELTESVAVVDLDLTIEKMKEINKLGFKIALDDFGTGFSSLSYLKHFPIHTLKIDKSFIQGIPHNGYDKTIVETTIMMSRHLDLKVVAEGVENNSQLEFLQKQNCQYYQGYLCSRPIPIDELNELIQNT